LLLILATYLVTFEPAMPIFPSQEKPVSVFTGLAGTKVKSLS
jgi:hypothetical protein